MDLGTENTLESEKKDQIEKNQYFKSSAIDKWHKVSNFINEDSRTNWKQTIISNLRRQQGLVKKSHLDYILDAKNNFTLHKKPSKIRGSSINKKFSSQISTNATQMQMSDIMPSLQTLKKPSSNNIPF